MRIEILPSLRACGFALATWLLPLSGHATLACVATGTPGVERCQAGLSSASALELHETQKASEWCWAASIAMLLRHYGVHVQQEEVVRAYWGSATNLGVAMSDVTSLLQRTWRDPSGRAYTGSVKALLTPAAGVGDTGVLQDLQEGRPVIIGTPRHAMVLVQVTYERVIADTPEQVIRVLDAVALDPAPGTGLRALRPGERVPPYLTRVVAREQEGAQPWQISKAMQAGR